MTLIATKRIPDIPISDMTPIAPAGHTLRLDIVVADKHIVPPRIRQPDRQFPAAHRAARRPVAVGVPLLPRPAIEAVYRAGAAACGAAAEIEGRARGVEESDFEEAG
ncbi:hypothetical protein V491_03186 [Pseudogymnoascus sp. VKM F-3775]|nr:hypothetical protein V491_03186 [Pseudogymnoascus sp. VKM F-3775]